MSDTGSYSENTEMQELNSSEGGGGGGGGDRISFGNSHLHYSHHQGGRHSHSFRKTQHNIRNSIPIAKKDITDCKRIIIAICLVIITAVLFVFVISFFEDFKKWKNILKSEPPPLPLSPPKSWSGHFYGFYQKLDDDPLSKDSTLTSNKALQAVASLDDQFFILEDIDKYIDIDEYIENESTNTTLYTVLKFFKNGEIYVPQIVFSFTSGVNFTQKSIREEYQILKPSDWNNYLIDLREVPTTITVETWAESGKNGVWQEVQHSSPEVWVKRTFFDDEMTAIYQTKTEEPQKANQWDILVIKYNRTK